MAKWIISFRKEVMTCNNCSHSFETLISFYWDAT